MNIELRTTVLRQSLLIEDSLSDILIVLMGIKERDNKSLGHKTSSLSLKSKTDLLYDLRKIDKDLYNKLIVFMEIRNQFIHNLSSDSFEIVLKRIDKKSQLIKIDKETQESITSAESQQEKESIYELAYLKLSYDIRKQLDEEKANILKSKIEELDIKIKSIERDTYDEILKDLGDSIDEFTGFFNGLMQERFGSDHDYGSTIRYGIRAFFEKKQREKCGS